MKTGPAISSSGCENRDHEDCNAAVLLSTCMLLMSFNALLPAAAAPAVMREELSIALLCCTLRCMEFVTPDVLLIGGRALEPATIEGCCRIKLTGRALSRPVGYIGTTACQYADHEPEN